MPLIFRKCPLCGANLDPVERCDCEEKTVANAANTDNGEVENGFPTNISTTILPKNGEKIK